MSQQEYIGDRSEWFKALGENVTVSDKSWWTTLWLSVFLGVFGADRFYLGRVGSGCLKFLTGGGMGIWWAADALSLFKGTMTDGEGRILKRPF